VGGWRRVLKFVEDLKINCENEENVCCVFVTESFMNLALGLDV